MPRDSVDWTNFGLTAFCAALGAIGVAFVPGLETLRWWLGGAGVVFLALSVVFFGLAVYRVPWMPVLLEKCRQKSRLWRRERVRRREGKKWQTAKKLKISMRESRVTLQGIHSLAPGTPAWPTLTGLTGTAKIEVINHYKRSVKLQRVWIGLFEATGSEIMPVNVSKLSIDGGPSEIQSAGRQAYNVEMSARFGKWIKPGEAEAFLIIETAGRERQRVKIETILFP